MMAAMNQSTVRASAFLVIAIALIAAGYLYQNRQAAVTQAVEVATSSNAAFAITASNGADERGSTNIIPISSDAGIKVPDYKRPLTFPKNTTLNAEAQSLLLKQYAKTQAVVIKDPLSFNEWIFLGNDNLIAGNYAIAQEYWEYVSLRWPTNQASFNNLGDLYMNYLKDYAKAEKNWLQAVKNKADDPGVYKNLFTLYSETSYKPTNTAAEDILKKGIAANPRAVNLQYDLAVYYKKLGRTADAKSMYQAAIDNANNQGQTQLAAQIKTELAAMK